MSFSSVKVTVPDISDGQVLVRSSCSATHKLPRGFSDELSFGQTDLVIVQNVGSERATVRLQARLTPEDAIHVGSSRGPSWALRRDEEVEVLMRPDEVLLLRSLHAIEPKSRTARRPDGIPLRAGLQIAS